MVGAEIEKKIGSIRQNFISFKISLSIKIIVVLNIIKVFTPGQQIASPGPAWMSSVLRTIFSNIESSDCKMDKIRK